jgi:hypothetical protein
VSRFWFPTHKNDGVAAERAGAPELGLGGVNWVNAPQLTYLPSFAIRLTLWD